MHEAGWHLLRISLGWGSEDEKQGSCSESPAVGNQKMFSPLLAADSGEDVSDSVPVVSTLYPRAALQSSSVVFVLA